MHLLETLPPERAFNIVDYVVISEALADGEKGGAITKVRAEVRKIYDAANDDPHNPYNPTNSAPFQETEQTVDGYMGLDAPLG